MTFSSPRRPNPPALLAIAVLHAGLFGALWAHHDRTAPHVDEKSLEPIQWLLPLAPRPAVKAPAPAPAQRAAVPRNKPRAAAMIMPPAAAAPAPSPSSAISAAASPAPASPPDPLDLATTPPAPATDALLRRHDWGAGKADHALRGGKLAALVRPTDTLQAGLERAFRDAGEAAPPKWFSAPEIREMSVSEGRMRMYKIRTAMGTYCFYKPDPSLQAGYDYKLMTCPREK